MIMQDSTHRKRMHIGSSADDKFKTPTNYRFSFLSRAAVAVMTGEQFHYHLAPCIQRGARKQKFHYQIRTTTRRQRGEFNRIYIGNSSVRDERSPQHFVLIINNAQSTEKRKKPRENRYEKLIRLHSSSSLNITFTAHPERQQRKICVL